MAGLFVTVVPRGADGDSQLSPARPIARDRVIRAFDDPRHRELLRIEDAAGGFFVWGAPPGPRNRDTWATAETGDDVLFVIDNVYRYAAKILGAYDNPGLAAEIWGARRDGATRRLIWFLTRPRPINRSVSDLAERLNRGYIGLTRISEPKLDAIRRDYGSIGAFITQELRPSATDAGLSELRDDGSTSAGEAAMSRELDRRDFSANRATTARENELEARRGEVENTSGLLGVDIPPFTIDRLDPTTGNAAVLTFAPQPPPGGLEGMTDESFIQRALETLQTVGPALGLSAGQPAEYSPDQAVQQTTSGARAVHLQQEYKSIPLFQAAEAVRFAPNGALAAVVGRTLTIDQDLDPSPTVSVEEAVRAAAQFVAIPGQDEQGVTDVYDQPQPPASVDLTGFTPRVLAEFESRPDRLSLLDQGPFQELISASLTWFPLADDQLRLAWEINVTLPDYLASFRTLVDAANGQLLYSKQLVHDLRARANVYLVDGADTRQVVDFPLPLTAYQVPIPTDLPQGFPWPWVDETMNATVGNAAFARVGETQSTYQGARQGDQITFNPAQPTGDEQNLLNIFFFNCIMHDLFYLLGFREVNGNFQQSSFGADGAAGDRVDARAYPGPVAMTASMFTPIDGSSPIMKMGLVTSTNRHTALDATVVFHEYMHGVTNRLVGGPQNVSALDAPQCRGMGEGWGDYIACVLTDRTTIASWVVNKPGGVRGFPYDANFPAQTENFSKLGTGRYTEEHNIGEIWCATLLEMNRRVGMARGLRLVVDALKLSPTNPSFLDMRDAILAALDFERDAAAQTATPMTPRDYATTKLGIWQAFAKFGMGPSARTNGPFLAGIAGDFNLPPGVGDIPADTSQPAQPTTPATPATQPTAPATTPATIRVDSPPTFRAVTIPDNDPQGVESALAVSQQGTVQSLKVTVNIIHPVPEDLVVTLIAPSGQQATLFDSVATAQPNLMATFDTSSSPSLAALTGQAIQGNWRLKVVDQARKDTGTLNNWSLELTPTAPAPGLTGPAGGTVETTETAEWLEVTEHQTSLDLHLRFPQAWVKEDFLVAFRGWFQQYEQTAKAAVALQAGYIAARDYIDQQGNASVGPSVPTDPGLPWNASPYYLNLIADW